MEQVWVRVSGASPQEMNMRIKTFFVDKKTAKLGFFFFLTKAKLGYCTNERQRRNINHLHLLCFFFCDDSSLFNVVCAFILMSLIEYVPHQRSSKALSMEYNTT